VAFSANFHRLAQVEELTQILITWWHYSSFILLMRYFLKFSEVKFEWSLLEVSQNCTFEISVQHSSLPVVIINWNNTVSPGTILVDPEQPDMALKSQSHVKPGFQSLSLLLKIFQRKLLLADLSFP